MKISWFCSIFVDKLGGKEGKKNDPPPPRAVICPNKERRYQMYQTDTQWQQPYDQYDLPQEQYLQEVASAEEAYADEV